MTAIEIVLILVGIVFMIGSFFVSEKLSMKELNKIAELSENEIKIITNKELSKVSGQIEEQAESVVADSIGRVERAMDKETNEKIMEIGEYSDTVLENMNKTHNEIMFLYSMLNDKHTELTELAGSLTELSGELGRMETKVKARIESVEVESNTEEKSGQKTAEEAYTDVAAVKTEPEKRRQVITMNGFGTVQAGKILCGNRQRAWSWTWGSQAGNRTVQRRSIT